LEALDT